MSIYGTCYFDSKPSAYRYYKNASGATKGEVDNKFAEGTIFVGYPKDLKPGDKVSLIPGEGRYQITTAD